MKILTILNLKGGVGKTTTAINLAEYIATIEKKRVLLIDADAQANLTHFFETEVPKHDNFFEIFSLREPVRPVILKKNLHIIPSNARTSKINSLIEDEKNSLYILKDVLKHHDITEIFDYCIIDCPPSLGKTVINAMIAADYLIIPVTSGKFAFEGMEAVMSMITKIQREHNPAVSVLGVLPTLFAANRVASQKLLSDLDQLNLPIFDSKIRYCEAFRRAEIAHQSVYDCDSRSNASFDMQAFSREVLLKIKTRHA